MKIFITAIIFLSFSSFAQDSKKENKLDMQAGIKIAVPIGEEGTTPISMIDVRPIIRLNDKIIVLTSVEASLFNPDDDFEKSHTGVGLGAGMGIRDKQKINIYGAMYKYHLRTGENQSNDHGIAFSYNRDIADFSRDRFGREPAIKGLNLTGDLEYIFERNIVIPTVGITVSF